MNSVWDWSVDRPSGSPRLVSVAIDLKDWALPLHFYLSWAMLSIGVLCFHLVVEF